MHCGDARLASSPHLVPLSFPVGVKTACRVVVDLLLPPRCLSCGVMTDRAGALCAVCWSRIAFLGAPYCDCCGVPFASDPGPATVCGACLRDPPGFARARAVFRYDDGSKRLVLGFKHADRSSLAASFARWMMRAGADVLADADLLVPVPLHRWRLLHRRYNQAALLANQLSRWTGIACRPGALERVRHTPSQGLLGRGQRQRNVQGAFRLAKGGVAVAGRRVLLVDDVLTTGATIEECVRVLRRGGATAVDVLTLARVVLV